MTVIISLLLMRIFDHMRYTRQLNSVAQLAVLSGVRKFNTQFIAST